MKLLVMARNIRPKPSRVGFPVRTSDGNLLLGNLIEGADVMTAHNAGKL
jgi:hypothetical protein